MADKLPIDAIVALPAATCKYLLIRCFHPNINDAEAGRLSGYKGKSGGTLKARVAGVLGAYLDAEGISLESIASVMRDAMSAEKTKEVLIKTKTSTGKGRDRQIKLGHEVEIVKLGPDHKTRLQASALLMNLHMAAEKNAPPALPAPEEESESDPHDGRTETEITDIANAAVEAEFEVQDG